MNPYIAERIAHDFNRRGRPSAIVGGQFGSEAKGLAAGIVARAMGNPAGHIATTNAGAQAGHTTILEDGTKFVCYHLPTIGVLNTNSVIYLNAGSIIDLDLLQKEIVSVGEATGEGAVALAKRVHIHPNAALITVEAKKIEAEGATTHLGSTQKGVGAALARKIMRQPGSVVGQFKDEQSWEFDFLRSLGGIQEIGLNEDYGTVSVEIPQGTGLSINASPFFPKATSRDCWLGQGLTDAGITPRKLGGVLMVCRTLPIRVGHIYGDNGDGVQKKVGDSGPFYTDSQELDWSQLPGIEPERTTVTQRVRRIATWSDAQFLRAMELNQPDHVLITFTNYLNQDQLAGLNWKLSKLIGRDRHPINVFYSWGPKVDDFGTMDEAMPFCSGQGVKL